MTRRRGHAYIRARRVVYQQAKAKQPERWPGDIRNSDLPEEVWLNPENECEILRNGN